MFNDNFSFLFDNPVKRCDRGKMSKRGEEKKKERTNEGGTGGEVSGIYSWRFAEGLAGIVEGLGLRGWFGDGFLGSLWMPASSSLFRMLFRSRSP